VRRGLRVVVPIVSAAWLAGCLNRPTGGSGRGGDAGSVVDVPGPRSDGTTDGPIATACGNPIEVFTLTTTGVGCPGGGSLSTGGSASYDPTGLTLTTTPSNTTTCSWSSIAFHASVILKVLHTSGDTGAQLHLGINGAALDGNAAALDMFTLAFSDNVGLIDTASSLNTISARYWQLTTPPTMQMTAGYSADDVSFTALAGSSMQPNYGNTIAVSVRCGAMCTSGAVIAGLTICQ
jgi:hypothetical protein